MGGKKAQQKRGNTSLGSGKKHRKKTTGKWNLPFLGRVDGRLAWVPGDRNGGGGRLQKKSKTLCNHGFLGGQGQNGGERKKAGAAAAAMQGGGRSPNEKKTQIRCRRPVGAKGFKKCRGGARGQNLSGLRGVEKKVSDLIRGKMGGGKKKNAHKKKVAGNPQKRSDKKKTM